MRRTIRIISASVLMLRLRPTRAQIRDPKETSTKFRNYRLLAAAVRKADRILLYEGLPHPVLRKASANVYDSDNTDYPW